MNCATTNPDILVICVKGYISITSNKLMGGEKGSMNEYSQRDDDCGSGTPMGPVFT